MPKNLYFPDKFLWGASTSSHQVEGHTTNDWTAWETSVKRLEHLKQSGQLKKYGLDNFISHTAANHFHLYKEDYALAKEMGHNATRLSLEWSRIEPQEGVFDESALNHYANMIRHIKSLGIEPLVTLWHWTIPLWFRDRGGWLDAQAPAYFTRYAERVVAHLKNEVTFWITLNEPEIYTANSYLTGIWPPQRKSIIKFLRVFHRLIAAHKQAFSAIKNIQPAAQIGIAKNNIYFEGAGKNPLNHALKKIYDHAWNFYFLDRIKHHQDFIGLNYYFHNRISWGFIKNENKIVSDLGWELHPEGIYHVLSDLKQYNCPVYITENGLADATDRERAWFIKEIVRNMHRALSDGVDVRGYLHWSLIDNFEWDKGFSPRFGLVEVDYKNHKRTPRPSAHTYRSIVTNNALLQE